MAAVTNRRRRSGLKQHRFIFLTGLMELRPRRGQGRSRPGARDGKPLPRPFQLLGAASLRAHRSAPHLRSRRWQAGSFSCHLSGTHSSSSFLHISRPCDHMGHLDKPGWSPHVKVLSKFINPVPSCLIPLDCQALRIDSN